jgi:hypothetical protein
MVWRGEGEGWWGCFVTITLMSLNYLRRSYSCVWKTRPKSRPREHVIWGTGVPLNLSPKQEHQAEICGVGGCRSDWVPGAKLSGVERSNVGESDYRLGPSRMARGWSIRILRFSRASHGLEKLHLFHLHRNRFVSLTLN